MLTVVISEWWDYRWFYVCPYPLPHAILTFIRVLLCNIESQKIYLNDNRESAKSWHAVTEGRGGEAWFWLCPLWLGDHFSTLSYWGQRPDPYIWQVVVLVDFETVVWVQWWGQFWLASGFVYCRSLTQSCPTLCTALTVACQAPLTVGFSQQEYWNGLAFPLPGDLPDSGIKPASPALAGGFFTIEPPGKPWVYIYSLQEIIDL